jgi:hypothetical protein
MLLITFIADLSNLIYSGNYCVFIENENVGSLLDRVNIRDRYKTKE